MLGAVPLQGKGRRYRTHEPHSSWDHGDIQRNRRADAGNRRSCVPLFQSKIRAGGRAIGRSNRSALSVVLGANGLLLKLLMQGMSKMVVMRSREKGKQEQSRRAPSANRHEHDRAFGRECHGSSYRQPTSARHVPQEMMLRSPDGLWSLSGNGGEARLLQPDLVVVEGGAADRRNRFRAG